MSILITGGCGYIGSQLSYILSDNNLKHTVVDNLSTGYIKLKNPRSSFIKTDISNKKIISQIIKKKKINCVMHLAASILVPESMEQPEKYYNNNVINLIKFLDTCVESGIKYFIFSSTCAVYGDIKKNKIRENDNKSPTSIYGKTKLIGENIIKYYAKKHKFNFVILRYFNVIGSDSKLRTGSIKNTGHLFGNIIDSLLTNKMTFNLYGYNYPTRDGSAIRDYIDVEDICKIHLEAYKKIKKEKKSYEFNCGVGNGHSVLKILKTFEKVVDKKFNIKKKPPRPGDNTKLICDTSFISKVLKINPENDLINSINNAINWKKRIENK